MIRFLVLLAAAALAFPPALPAQAPPGAPKAAAKPAARPAPPLSADAQAVRKIVLERFPTRTCATLQSRATSVSTR